jgi:hypothetical protein
VDVRRGSGYDGRYQIKKCGYIVNVNAEFKKKYDYNINSNRHKDRSSRVNRSVVVVSMSKTIQLSIFEVRKKWL